MKPRTWILLTIAVAAGTALLTIALNMSLDIYGIFRDPHGRKLDVYGDERIAKYLLSERYVPENFNAVLIGSSVTANWKTRNIEGLRVYNESLRGGNIVEEKAVMEQALSRPGIRVAFLLVHPFMTSSHEFETVPLTPRENIGALGSQSLLDAYKDVIRSRYRPGDRDDHFDEFGTNDYEPPSKLNATLTAMMKPGADFAVDDVALQAYGQLVSDLRTHGIQIVFLIPPVSQRILDIKRDAFLKYDRMILTLEKPGDSILGFSSEKFDSSLGRNENFSDGVHLTRAGAARLIRVLNACHQSGGFTAVDPSLAARLENIGQPAVK